jgi:hypothetical protein
MFHAFGFKDNNMILCSDLAGHSSAYIEERYPNTVCMYTMGAAADQMPLYIAEGYTVDASGDLTVSYLSPQGALGVLDAQAEQLGEAIIAAIRGMDPASAVSKVSLRTLRSTVTVDGKVKDEDRSDTYKGPTTIPTSQAGYAYDLKADPVDIKIGVIQLGQYAIASVGCEITAQIGTDIQNALQALGYADTVLVSQCNGSKQYLTTDEGYAAFTFEGHGLSHGPRLGGQGREGLLRPGGPVRPRRPGFASVPPLGGGRERGAAGIRIVFPRRAGHLCAPGDGSSLPFGSLRWARPRQGRTESGAPGRTAPALRLRPSAGAHACPGSRTAHRGNQRPPGPGPLLGPARRTVFHGFSGRERRRPPGCFRRRRRGGARLPPPAASAFYGLRGPFVLGDVVDILDGEDPLPGSRRAGGAAVGRGRWWPSVTS